MLHIFNGPTPQAVEDLLFVQLHRHHHTVGKALGACVAVLDVGHIGHIVAHLKINPVGAFKEIMISLRQLGINVLLFIPGLKE